MPKFKRPVVCFDESPTQLIGEARQPISAVPGQLERYGSLADWYCGIDTSSMLVENARRRWP